MTVRWVVLAVLLVFAGAPMRALPVNSITCMTTSATPTTVRGDGVTERLNDIVLKCSGGIPTASGAPVPTVGLQLFLNTSVTNRSDPSGFVDAFMIIDEPHSVANPTVPLLACASGCSINGTGDGTTTYNGTTGHPNVFPAQAVGGITNSISWNNIPLDAPGDAFRTIRITNVRANARDLALAGSLFAAQITAFLAFNGSQSLVIANPTVPVSFLQFGLQSSFTTVANLSLCSPANPGIAANPSQPLNGGGQNGAQFSVTLTEGFPAAFAAKNEAQTIANAPSGGVFPSATYPVDVNQNIPGFGYNTETGFFNFGLDPVPFPTNPAIPFTANFPNVDGLNLAGVATQGTRVFVQLSDVPSTGFQLFVPVQIPLVSTDSSNLGQRTGTAVLVSTDDMGAGAYAPVTGNASGLAPLQVSGTTALAVYEVLYADPNHTEAMTVPIAAAYGSNVLASLPQEAVSVQTGFAPISSVPGSGDATVPVPRFFSPTNSQVAFSVDSCGPDVTVTATHSGNLTVGGSGGVLSLVVNNVGGLATTGTVSVTDMLPTGLIASAISGAGWTCSLGDLSCSRSDSLSSGAAYPAVNINATVSANAAASVVNSASVSGGGESNTGNDTASDLIQITPLETVIVGTRPEGLAFTVDGSGYTSTQTFQWLPGSTHTLSVNATQVFQGVTYMFDQWSDLLGQSHSITVGSETASYFATYLTSAETLQPSKAGIFRQGFLWVLDTNGNQRMDIPPDYVYAFGGIPGDIPIAGDWNGDGHTKIGIYRPSNGLFILDTNGDGVLDSGDSVFNLHIGMVEGDVPIVGDWNGDGRSKVGYFRQGFLWILDTNGDGLYEKGEQSYVYGGIQGDVPVVGDWTGTGTSKIGVFRQGFLWVLDANGNGTFDGTAGGDLVFPYGGIPGDVPVAGDWAATGISQPGIFRQGFLWALDANGDHVIDAGDYIFAYGGIAGDVPVVGKW